VFPFSPGQVAGYGIVALLVLAVGWRYLQRPPEPPPAVPAPAVAAEAAAPVAVVVAVSGEVRRPGVYRLAGGARVQDAVARARPTRRADLEAINLAVRLADGEQVVVPRRGTPAAASAGGSAGAGGDGGIVHLNSATQAELEELDGIGPALASRIIEYRDQHGGFASVEELDEVSGIGPARLAALADHVAP
jgi:competence protein ComEA